MNLTIKQIGAHLPEAQRTPAAYRRDLLRARQVVAQLREQALEADEPFHVGNLALDAAVLDEFWYGLDRIDSHFYHEERMGRSRLEARKRPTRRWWRFWW